MTWRLFRFILLFAAFLAFAVANLDHRADLSLGFTVFRDAPVFLIASFAFVAGMVFAIALGATGRSHRARSQGSKPGRKGKEGTARRRVSTSEPLDSEDYGID